MSSIDNYTTMSIASFGPPTLGEAAKVNYGPFLPKKTNDISDIDGAARYNKCELLVNKPEFHTTDVPGATSKPLTHSRNTRDNTLYIDDIEGTRNRVKDRMAITERRINPLVPQYQLPSFAPVNSAPTRFIRDELYHSDVVGSHPKPLYQTATRDTFNVNDIEGAQVGWNKRNTEARDIMNFADVAARNRYVDKTLRCSNPLDPSYVVNGMEVYDDPKFTKPKPTKQYIPDNLQLQTADIPGATTGWREKQRDRKDVRNTNYLDDIVGAHADTVKHSIRTTRMSNPLLPVYQSLDPGEQLEPVVAPLLPVAMIRTPTLRAVKTSAPPQVDNGHFSIGQAVANRNTSITSGGGNRGDSASTKLAFAGASAFPSDSGAAEKAAAAAAAVPPISSFSTSYADKISNNNDFFASGSNFDSFGKPPSGRNEFNLTNNQKDSSWGNDYASNNSSNNNNNVFSAPSSAPLGVSWGPNNSSGNGAASGGFSPFPSGRNNGSRSNSRSGPSKADRARQEDIDSVRNLF